MLFLAGFKYIYLAGIFPLVLPGHTLDEQLGLEMVSYWNWHRVS